jgi:putative aldouronate transport system permease protein
MAVCTVLGIVIERLAYKPLRSAPSLAVLITAIGVSYFLQNAALLIWTSNPKSFSPVVGRGAVQMGELQITHVTLVTIVACVIIMVALNTYNLIIARTFIQNTIPNDLYESAMLDGANHFTIFWHIVLPLSKAIIAVEILYYAVFHWNDYFNALIYTSGAEVQPLQMVLRRILLQNEAFASGNGGVQGGYAQSSADQVKYAVIIVSTVPILLVYPFVQKYFEKGVMIGAVKG